MGDSGYHMEAQRKARMLKKKTEAMARIQELQQGNFNSVTFNPTVGDCLQMQDNGPDQYYSITRTNNNNIENGFRSAAAAVHQQLPLLAVGQASSRSTPIFSSRLSTGRQSTLRSVTPVQLSGRFQTPSLPSGRPMTGSGGSSPAPPPQTPGLEELLGQQRSVYSTDLFPEYEDDRELFDTFTYI